MHRESRVWDAETVEDIRLRSSMKVGSKGNEVLLVVTLGTLAYIEYSSVMLIPASGECSQQKFPVEVYSKN